jgi:hypothetical protein
MGAASVETLRSSGSLNSTEGRAKDASDTGWRPMEFGHCQSAARSGLKSIQTLGF